MSKSCFQMTSLRALFGKIDENLKTVEASTSEWTNRYEESVGKAKERKEEDLRNKEKLERIYNGLYNARRAQRTKSSKPSASTVHTEMSQSIQHPSASESVHITLPPLAHHSISVSLAACKSIDSNNEFTLSSQHASMEGSWSIIMVTSASTTSEAPILKPWRRSQQPWTRNRSSVSASLRKMISLMNKATVRKPLAAEFTALLIEDSYNIKILQDMLINRTLRYPETARLHVQILRSTIRHYLDTVKCEGEEDCNCHDVSSGIGNLLNRKGLFSCMDYLTVWLVLQWHPDFAVFNFQYAYEDIYKKAPPKDQYMLVAMVERAAELSRTNRQRMCGFLMMWAEIMKHGMLENVGPLDEILDSLQQRQHFPLLEDHAFDASFVIKWFLTLKKKFVDGLYESEESYDDDTDNYAARKTPKWKKDNSNVDVHFTRANFFVNQVTTGNTRLQELEKSFFDADEFFVPASDDGSDEEDEEYEEFDPYKAIFCLATHVSRAVLADQGRKAELMAEFAVTVAKQRFIDVYDKENEYLDPFLSYVCFETADFVKEVKEKVYEDSADLKREVSTVITSFMRFVGTIFNHDLERPKALLDGWLGNELVVDALNDLRDYEELHCEYLFKWLDRLKIQVSLDDVTLQ
ncbi:hypothetical protein QR680_007689 [Steinernema hermaphroditum]|uniref:Uncharacterized protein n=1 Tax=Steinernema hermaphroditum TaxID=289476 RepID=A0AA39IG54_9BILA|nr:hypothetical protein QR680_007689 [Steinernema hermaphroditum]